MSKEEFKILEGALTEANLTNLNNDGWKPVFGLETVLKGIYRIVFSRHTPDDNAYDESLTGLLKLVQSPELVEKNIRILQNQLSASKAAQHEAENAKTEATRQIHEAESFTAQLIAQQETHRTAVKQLEENVHQFEMEKAAHDANVAALSEKQRIHNEAVKSHQADVAKFATIQKAHEDKVVADHKTLDQRSLDLGKIKDSLDSKASLLAINEAALKEKLEKLKSLAG